ncbi:MAG: hypothetical protein NTX00_03010 [Candidatus Parcubacteria bacterium]|nr:hypothetical protein [Candidatus Parcubacteria bacterium]
MFNLNYLELFILNTIIYFDLFDYPLTLGEIHNFLFTGGMEGASFSLAEITECLQTSLKLKKAIATQRGFYFLKNPPSRLPTLKLRQAGNATADEGRENNIQTRLERYVLAQDKFKIINRAIKIFKYLPFVKLVAICNNLALSNAKKESDLDLFIITSQKRIWVVRFFTILIITILGLRPPKNKVKDKICLSFFIAEDNLDLAKIKITAEDVYLVFWLATLRPVYERQNFYAQLIAANLWLKKYLPNWQEQKLGFRYRIEDNKLNKIIYKTKEFFWGGFLGDWAEKIFKNIQFKLMSQKKKDLAVQPDTGVIISDSMLKFHLQDRRLEIMAEFEKRRKELVEKM